MRQFNRIAIIGVGLIGGSIGLGIKKRGAAGEVIGVFRHKATLKKALKRKAVDKGVMSVKDGVKDADLIILATPVFSIPIVAAEVIKYAKKGAIITDAGSTKRWVSEKIEKLIGRRPEIFYVGSHPMAGSEKTSVVYAREGLLEGSPCIVTRTPGTDKRSLGKMTAFWKSLGAKVKIMSPAGHDRSISLISHLPHLVAFSLAGAVPEKELIYAAEGFKDTTRIAASDPSLWADIFLSNRSEVLRSARIFESYYGKLVGVLSKGGHSKMVKFLKAAGTKRNRLVHG